MDLGNIIKSAAPVCLDIIAELYVKKSVSREREAIILPYTDGMTGKTGTVLRV